MRMGEAAGSDIETKVKIQDELLSMNAVVTKIKQELHEINNIIQSNGTLDVALENAVDSLLVMAKNAGVEVDQELNAGADNPMADAFSRISTSYITEKLKSLSQE